jgi:nucleotide-binding universal stress UspA family protein
MEATPVRPVVVGVSGSPASRRAVEAGAREAAARGVPLRLVHILDDRTWQVDQPRNAGDLLRQARTLTAATAPGLWTTTELLEGDPATGLIRLSRHAALTVLGDGGLTDLRRSSVGVTTLRVAGRAPGSILVSRAEAVPHGSVLVVLGHATINDELPAAAFDAAAGRGTDVRVIHVGPPPHRSRAVKDVPRSRRPGHGVKDRSDVLAGDPVPGLRRAMRDASLTVAGPGLPAALIRTLLEQGRGPVLILRRTRPDTRTPEPTSRPGGDSAVSVLLGKALRPLTALKTSASWKDSDDRHRSR